MDEKAENKRDAAVEEFVSLEGGKATDVSARAVRMIQSSAGVAGAVEGPPDRPGLKLGDILIGRAGRPTPRPTG